MKKARFKTKNELVRLALQIPQKRPHRRRVLFNREVSRERAVQQRRLTRHSPGLLRRHQSALFAAESELENSVRFSCTAARPACLGDAKRRPARRVRWTERTLEFRGQGQGGGWRSNGTWDATRTLFAEKWQQQRAGIHLPGWLASFFFGGRPYLGWAFTVQAPSRFWREASAGHGSSPRARPQPDLHLSEKLLVSLGLASPAGRWLTLAS